MTADDESMSNNSDNVARTDASDAGSGPGTGRTVGEGVGGLAGVAAGAGIGSLAGPVGTVIGAIAGAIGGWWAGREVGTAASGYDEHDTAFRRGFTTRSAGTTSGLKSYDQARPAYQLGYLASQNPDYSGKRFDEVEGDLRRGWNADMEKQAGYSWDDARGHVADAYERGRTSGDEQRMTRAEEELVVSKRTVQAGEVGLKKSIETEHVSKKIPLSHEEIEVERHAVAADSATGDVDFGEKDIRIPLSAEEAVVNKRVVAKEEVIVTKRAVEETRNVEADIRKEQIDIDRTGRAKDENREMPER